MRLSIPQWELVSRSTFMVYSSGIGLNDRPDYLYQDNELTVLFRDLVQFQSFKRQVLLFEATKNVAFAFTVTTGTEVVGTMTFNRYDTSLVADVSPDGATVTPVDR